MPSASAMCQSAGSVAGSGADWISDSGLDGDLAAVDASYFSAAVNASTTQSDTLLCNGFGFTGIPAGATLVGIEVFVDRVANSAASGIAVRDLRVQLRHGGAATGDNKADVANDWPTTDTQKVYGGNKDMWGTTLTMAQATDATLEVEIEVQRTGAGVGTRVGSIDAVEVVLHYNDPVSGTVGSAGCTAAALLAIEEEI